MKAKVFEVMLHRLPTGETPAGALEAQLNRFLNDHPQLRVVTTHINTIVAPAPDGTSAGPGEPAGIIFCTMFYTS